MKLFLVIVAIVFLTGCATKPWALSPSFPSRAPINDVVAIDSRRPVDKFLGIESGEVPLNTKTREPHPAQGMIVGNMNNILFTFAGDQTAAQALASVVANKYPQSTVEVLDCRSVMTPGMWVNGFSVYISIKITIGDRSALINAGGQNSWAILNQRNMEIAFERALEDLKNKLNALAI
jgi:hypothetical protein